MADKKNVQNNVTTQEVAQQVVEATNEVLNAQAVAIAQDAVQQVPQVPAQTQEAQVPAAVPPQTFAEKHPKLAAFGAKAKKVGKVVGISAAIFGGLFVAHKLGEASGFDKATDAYNNRTSGDDPEPDYDPDDLGDEGIEEVNEN